MIDWNLHSRQCDKDKKEPCPSFLRVDRVLIVLWLLHLQPCGLSLLPDGLTTVYTHEDVTRYFEMYIISVTLAFSTKGGWLLVIGLYASYYSQIDNVYPLIACLRSVGNMEYE